MKILKKLRAWMKKSDAPLLDELPLIWGFGLCVCGVRSGYRSGITEWNVGNILGCLLLGVLVYAVFRAPAFILAKNNGEKLVYEICYLAVITFLAAKIYT